VSWDSAYDQEALLLKPWQGAAAGLVGGFLASLVVPQGQAVLLPLGLLAGGMYALCQQRAPGHGLLAVGLFYGFFLWLIFGVLLGGLMAASPLKEELHSQRWLLAGLAYGTTLAFSGLLVKWTRPKTERALPKD
jgi:hypothetical protein